MKQMKFIMKINVITKMISIANTAITKIANQLLLHSAGAKNPRMYSIPPTAANRLVREILNASLRFVEDTTNRTIPVSRITALFKYTLVDW